jgi:hypothetical protein
MGLQGSHVAGVGAASQKTGGATQAMRAARAEDGGRMVERRKGCAARSSWTRCLLLPVLLNCALAPQQVRAFSASALQQQHRRFRSAVRMTSADRIGPCAESRSPTATTTLRRSTTTLRRAAATDDARLRRVLALVVPADKTEYVRQSLAPLFPQASVIAAAAVAAASAEMEINGVPIAESLFALTVGVTAVAAATALVDASMSTDVPPFDPSTQRFDQSQFGGRYCQMLLACDPRLLLYSRAQV